MRPNVSVSVSDRYFTNVIGEPGSPGLGKYRGKLDSLSVDVVGKQGDCPRFE